jgi:hypothetical protein
MICVCCLAFISSYQALQQDARDSPAATTGMHLQQLSLRRITHNVINYYPFVGMSSLQAAICGMLQPSRHPSIEL